MTDGARSLAGTDVTLDVDPALAQQRQATGVLVEATRRLMCRVAASDATPEELRSVAAAVDAVSERMGEPGPRVMRVAFDEEATRQVREGAIWTMFQYNPMMIPLRIGVEGPTGRAEMTPGALHEGPPGLLHGGIAAHILDAFLGSLVQAQGRPGYTARLDLAFRAPTLLHRPIVIEGEMTPTQGRKMRAHGWISQDGRRTVEADGLFVAPA